MAGLHAPLSTLRLGPHDPLRMTRGQLDSLCLGCRGLAPLTPCRSPGALLNCTQTARSHRLLAALIGRPHRAVAASRPRPGAGAAARRRRLRPPAHARGASARRPVRRGLITARAPPPWAATANGACGRRRHRHFGGPTGEPDRSMARGACDLAVDNGLHRAGGPGLRAQAPFAVPMPGRRLAGNDEARVVGHGDAPRAWAGERRPGPSAALSAAGEPEDVPQRQPRVDAATCERRLCAGSRPRFLLLRTHLRMRAALSGGRDSAPRRSHSIVKRSNQRLPGRMSSRRAGPYGGTSGRAGGAPIRFRSIACGVPTRPPPGAGCSRK